MEARGPPRRREEKPQQATNLSREEILEARRRLKEGCKIIPGGCWLWLKAKTKNYGRIYLGGKGMQAPRAAYQLWKNDGKYLPNKMDVCHVGCHNPECCYPKHVTLGTRSENAGDRVGQGTQPEWSPKNYATTTTRVRKGVRIQDHR